MSGGGFRLGSGGLIDRSRPLSFTFDGRSYQGCAGDTLASALLANGVRVVGRSFKYHRPRGVLSAGHEEPNALVELRSGARREPNVKATTIELYDGLVASSQNRWPSLGFDVMALNGLLKPVFAAGFYYKTFMWPASFWEKIYEPVIRRAAGLGRASALEDPDSYEHSNAHCDLLVAGGGGAGLMAALTAGRSGAKVILCEDQPRLGGRLLDERESVGGQPAAQWVNSVAAELAAMPNVRVFSRASVVAAFDGGVFAALERVADHLPEPPPFTPRQRFWRIAARRAIIATGASERPLAFPDNDRPGIMLAGAVRSYLNRFGVAAGRQIAVYTATDDGWLTARDLIKAGLPPVVVIDAREKAPAEFADVAKAVPVVLNGAVVATQGRKGLSAITVKGSGAAQNFAVDALAVSGGFNPSIQLASCFRGRPAWSDKIQAFLAPGVDGLHMAGAAAGVFAPGEALKSGADAGSAALQALGLPVKPVELPAIRHSAAGSAPAWWRPGRGGDARVFVDFQHDVTASDVILAHREGYRSVEHLKRYTTLGMATDQGRTANLDALAIMAQLTGQSIPQTGVTLARPPVVPVALGAVAGAHRRGAFKPLRETPIHAYALERGAPFVDAGQWKRPQYFPLAGDADLLATANREVNAVRSGVGVTDVSTLGKVEVEGPDAAKFLDLVCAMRPSAIKVGRCGYLIMLREDGFLKDDGMFARFAEDRYVAYVSTAHAAPVYRHMQYCRQVLWPELDVNLTAVTDGWAQLAIAGPKSPAVLQALVDAPVLITQADFPPMRAAEITICGGVPARLCALSFSGERSFELGVPAGFGDALIRRVMAVGEPYGVVAYGSEAMGVMRIEKGHPAGGEINGQTTAYDLGMARALAKDKDHVGRVLCAREALVDPARPRLVGVRPLDPGQRIRSGAHIIPAGAVPGAETDLGWISSACWSPTLSSWIGLALASGGPDRIGEKVRVYDPLRGGDVAAEIVASCFVDPKGERSRV
ncbi:sarcosine oxidase subunit alpha family protein [Methylocella tundrae]|uniref:sarcosine oxidase subunit alpha family protein n=1 Tax=Methylocella tundrae TaxID=227605 RepID=UPI0030FF3A4B|nr:sarcosine oxidase subunit alpha family protein [Methylocella tundrae]WPP03807.1 sarcosine oxidase subunit alpha family protein [Methylocella tundrae]